MESLETLIYSAASAALSDAALERSDLDGVVLAASDQVDGRAISSMLTSGPAGAYLNEEINVASSPGHAVAMAYMQILSGSCRRLLVSSWGKASETQGGSTQPAERLSLDPFFERDAPLSPLSAVAMQACRHRMGSSDPERATQAALRVAARNHGCWPSGVPVTADEVSRSALIAFPLRALERPPEIDAAVSLVLEAPGRDHEPTVALQGVGWCAETGRLAERDLVGVPHLARAASDACERAGLRSPASEVGLWELHDYSPDAELIAYPAVGLCASGEAIELALSDAPVFAARINPDGGSVRGEAPFGGPMSKLLHAVTRVRGWSDGGLGGPPRALAQMASGFAGQFQTVAVIGVPS